ncbi:MAG: hypothetical protein U0165_13365 [Polyangiaceae bacterium]
MMVGGAAVVVLWKLVGSSDYLGLGVPASSCVPSETLRHLYTCLQ